MKRTLLAATLALGSLTALPAFAQAPAPPAPQHMHHVHDPHRQAMRMSKRLGLTPDQTAKVEPILAQRQQQAMAIRQNTALTPEQRTAQIRELTRNTHQQLAGVLTPDQMQQLKAMHQGRRMHQQESAPAPSGM